MAGSRPSNLEPSCRPRAASHDLPRAIRDRATLAKLILVIPASEADRARHLDKVSCKGSTKFLIEMGERTAADDLRKGVAVTTRWRYWS